MHAACGRHRTSFGVVALARDRHPAIFAWARRHDTQRSLTATTDAKILDHVDHTMTVGRRLGTRLALLLASVTLCATFCAVGSSSERAAAQPRRAASDPFTPMSDEALAARITAASAEARASDRRVLLEFVASWCADCREVVRLAAREPARTVLAHGYVVVPVEVGRFDRHVDLIERYGVRAIATLVVLDPATGERVAQTTLEPITGSQVGLTSADLAAWLTSPTGGETRRPTRLE